MAVTAGVLGQTKPAATTNTSVYSPAAGVTARLTALVICNTTGGDLSYRIFLDDDGTTYDTTTGLYYDVLLAANSTLLIDLHWYMDNSAGNLAVYTSAAGLTFTLFGIESN